MAEKIKFTKQEQKKQQSGQTVKSLFAGNAVGGKFFNAQTHFLLKLLFFQLERRQEAIELLQ